MAYELIDGMIVEKNSQEVVVGSYDPEDLQNELTSISTNLIESNLDAFKERYRQNLLTRQSEIQTMLALLGE